MNDINRERLVANIKQKKSFLCVGLDSDAEKVAEAAGGHMSQSQFNRKIVEATAEHAVAYKINTAFYESQGSEGWEELERTVRHIKDYDPNLFIIADAKRGDIGNTAKQYAKAFFETLQVNAVTIQPYMGEDSAKPFLSYPHKWGIILALTSNDTREDFQTRKLQKTIPFDLVEPPRLYEEVLKKATTWGTPNNTMFVIGATTPDVLRDIRVSHPGHFFLVPGVGAQGGSLEEVTHNGLSLDNDCGLLVNSSRGVIFACLRDENFRHLQGSRFHEAAGAKAKEMQQVMERELEAKGLV